MVSKNWINQNIFQIFNLIQSCGIVVHEFFCVACNFQVSYSSCSFVPLFLVFLRIALVLTLCFRIHCACFVFVILLFFMFGYSLCFGIVVLFSFVLILCFTFCAKKKTYAFYELESIFFELLLHLLIDLHLNWISKMPWFGVLLR